MFGAAQGSSQEKIKGGGRAVVLCATHARCIAPGTLGVCGWVSWGGQSTYMACLFLSLDLLALVVEEK